MTGWKHPAPESWAEIVWAALDEDLGPGDLSAACLDPDSTVDWHIEAQASGVICGAGIIGGLFAPEGDDPDNSVVEVLMGDGEPCDSGDIVARGKTLSTKLLARERTGLNFLMLLSGVATLTRNFVERLEGLDVQICDTRKTVPGLRGLQKYAVRCGGGKNHRMGLFDGVMVKDNHIAAAGSIREAIERARHRVGHMTKIEVECEHIDQVREAVANGADIVLLDNMDPFSMSDVAREFRDKVILEASGGVNIDTVRGVASSGVHVISVGALTHSAPSLAFHLEVL